MYELLIKQKKAFKCMFWKSKEYKIYLRKFWIFPEETSYLGKLFQLNDVSICSWNILPLYIKACAIMGYSLNKVRFQENLEDAIINLQKVLKMKED